MTAKRNNQKSLTRLLRLFILETRRLLSEHDGILSRGSWIMMRFMMNYTILLVDFIVSRGQVALAMYNLGTTQIEVILSPPAIEWIKTSFNFIQPLEVAKFCRNDKDFSLKRACHTKGVVAATCSLVMSLRPGT